MTIHRQRPVKPIQKWSVTDDNYYRPTTMIEVAPTEGGGFVDFVPGEHALFSTPSRSALEPADLDGNGAYGGVAGSMYGLIRLRAEVAREFAEALLEACDQAQNR